MFEMFLYIMGVVFSGLVSLVLALLLSDQVKIYLGKAWSNLSTTVEGIEGVWCATFTINRLSETITYQEHIRIRKYFGVYFGNIEPSPHNYEALRQVDMRRPLRLRAEIQDSTYFTGLWYHPIDIARFHGAFQLVIHPSGKGMKGRWVGYSETLHEIDAGEWSFERVPNAGAP